MLIIIDPRELQFYIIVQCSVKIELLDPGVLVRLSSLFIKIGKWDRWKTRPNEKWRPTAMGLNKAVNRAIQMV